MLQSIKNSILYSSTIFLFIISSSVSAVTICSYNCPGSSGSGNNEPPLPQIIEFTSPDGSPLVLDINGLIFLDINLFNNLPGLSISSSTPVYNGLSELPSNISLPEQFELNLIEFAGGGLSLNGGTVDYSLLRNFQTNSQINLSTPDGIVLLDTNALFAVPLPASFILFLSGITLLVSRYAKKKI